MSSISKKPELKLENVALWYKCVECKRCFHSLPLLEQHFNENHKEAEFILPTKLPAGVKEGKIYMKSKPRDSKMLPTKFPSRLTIAQLLVNEVPEQLDQATKSSKVSNIQCKICKLRLKTWAALSFHTKRQHQNTVGACVGVTENLQENGISSSNGLSKPSSKPLMPSTENAIGKRRSILSVKAKAVVSTAKIRTAKIFTGNGKRKLKIASNLDHVVYREGGTKYYGCPKCPFRVINLRRLEGHAKVHWEGSTAIPCDQCGWYVTPTGLKSHTFRRHLFPQKKISAQK